MRVKIDQIREGGLKLDEQVPLQQVEEALSDLRATGFRADQGFLFHAHLRKVGSGVLLDGRFTAQVLVPCKRCVGEVRLDLPQEFTLSLVPRSPAAKEAGGEEKVEDDGRSERAGSFRLEEAEEEYFEGKVIDLDPLLREQILLALPMNALCKEDCLGLCGACGQNLNEGPCGCDPRPLDPRLAVLKDIKLN